MSSAEQATKADPTPPAADPGRAIDFLSAWPGERAWVYTFPDGRLRTETECYGQLRLRKI